MEGFKTWQCADCGERGVGDMEQLALHWKGCTAYQGKKEEWSKPTNEEIEQICKRATDINPRNLISDNFEWWWCHYRQCWCRFINAHGSIYLDTKGHNYTIIITGDTHDRHRSNSPKS